MSCPVCCSNKTHSCHDAMHLEPDEFWCDTCGFSWQERIGSHSYYDDVWGYRWEMCKKWFDNYVEPFKMIPRMVLALIRSK